jgi:hypothetical protein
LRSKEDRAESIGKYSEEQSSGKKGEEEKKRG